MTATFTALSELLGHRQVYAELKHLARRQLARRPTGASLNTTALVHEACLKLAQAEAPTERAHWLNLAALAMRQVICDHARRRLRRHALIESMDTVGLAELPVQDIDTAAIHEARRLLAIDAALDELSVRHPRSAYVLSARFFGGLSERETAEAAGLSVRTIQREWQVARSWLRARLGQGE